MDPNSDKKPDAPSTALARAPMTEEQFKLALEPNNYDQAAKLAAIVAKAGLFKCRSFEDAVVRIMSGRALGLPMFASLKGIYSVDGAVGIESKLKVALAISRPECEYIRCTERSTTRATYVAKRRGQPEFSLTFTIEEAQAAGLLDYATPEKAKAAAWTRWRADMLMSKASGKIVDIVFPEAGLGLDSIEDLRDARAIETTGEVVAEVVTATPASVPSRDFEAEAVALKQKIADAKSPADRKAVRGEVTKFCAEAGEPWAADLKAFYNMTSGTKPAKAEGYLPPEQRGDSYSGPEEPPIPFGAS